MTCHYNIVKITEETKNKIINNTFNAEKFNVYVKIEEFAIIYFVAGMKEIDTIKKEELIHYMSDSDEYYSKILEMICCRGQIPASITIKAPQLACSNLQDEFNKPKV